MDESTMRTMRLGEGDMAIAEASAISATITGLWRYPVKSMQGEELNAAEVTERAAVRLPRRVRRATARRGAAPAGPHHPARWNAHDERGCVRQCGPLGSHRPVGDPRLELSGGTRTRGVLA